MMLCAARVHRFSRPHEPEQRTAMSAGVSLVIRTADMAVRDSCHRPSLPNRVQAGPQSRLPFKLRSFSPPMTTLIIATRNAHKVEEIRGILGNQFAFRTLRDFPGAPAVVEDAPTFAGNATKKAVELARWLSTLNSQ